MKLGVIISTTVVCLLPVITTARCYEPSEPYIPSGSFADFDEIEDAVDEVESFVSEMVDYVSCLEDEISDKEDEIDALEVKNIERNGVKNEHNDCC